MIKPLFYTVFAFTFISFGCGELVPPDTKNNIDLLRNAQTRLRENPENDQALSVILDMAKSRNSVNRSNAACVLGDAAEQSERFRVFGKEKAIPILMELLEKGEQSERKCAAQGIRGFGRYAAAAVPLLRKNLFPSNLDVTRVSAEALGRIGEPAVDALPELLRVIAENLSEEPGSHQVGIRQSAVRAIGQIGPPAGKASPDLNRYLAESRIPRFKIEVAVALIRIDPQSQQGRDAIKSFLQDPDIEIRRQTIWELEDAGAEARPVADLVKAAQNDSDADVRSGAAKLVETVERP